MFSINLEKQNSRKRRQEEGQAKKKLKKING